MVVEVERDGIAVSWDPDDGARLTALRFGGHQVLGDLEVPGAPRFWTHGSFPMVPYAGRVYDGVLHTRDGELRLTGPGSDGHVMHGVASDRPWTMLNETTARIELDERWPFGGWAEQRVDVTSRSVTVSLTVGNDERAMPVWLGFHPWFRRRLDRGGELRIGSRLGEMYEKDDAGRLTGRTVPPGPGPHDDCFWDPELPVRLEWPEALTLLLTSEAGGVATKDFVVFDERPEAICVEPQSAPPQADRLGRMQHVGPASPLTLTLTLRPEHAQ